MAERPKTEELREETYEQARKLLVKIVRRLAEEAIKKGGGTVLARPIAKIYGEYANQFLDLWRAARFQGRHWTLFRHLHSTLSANEMAVSKIIDETPIPVIKENGLVILFASLLDPNVARQYQQAVGQLTGAVKTILTHLDSLFATLEVLDQTASELVNRARREVASYRLKNSYDNVFVHHSLDQEISNLCQEQNRLFLLARRVLDHRNSWAKLIGEPERFFSFGKNLEKTCDALQ